jgi:acetyl-CoA carboxylase, biotin carboxylase subunit
VRIYAEDPDEGFLPSPGRITHLRPPSGPGIRDDSGAFEGWTVPTAYDPLISKVVAWAPDRPGAIRRMVRALTEYDLRGIRTTIGFCRDLVQSGDFAAAQFDTTYVDRLLEQNGKKVPKADDLEETAAIASAIWADRRSSIFDRPSSEASEARPASDDRPVSGAGRSTLDAGRSSEWARRGRWESLR